MPFVYVFIVRTVVVNKPSEWMVGCTATAAEIEKESTLLVQTEVNPKYA